MKIKTKDLTGPALGWAVAKALDRLGKYIRDELRLGTSVIDIDFDDERRQLAVYVPGRKRDPYVPWAPSTDWAQGGPIIEREQIQLTPEGWRWGAYTQIEEGDGDDIVAIQCVEYGSTLLVAAMRCFVASKLGDEVDVPDELT